ncbi:hypothetical protein [Sulfurovum lithotrophicum]|uniref:hypothetical protein n=1 Tax=Sulfurovum lithotrophicum TaxID=206403 RepID=UPI0009FD69BF|nr:hypothetical protein [Sulfurovum lithotrophicum]
MPKINRVEAIAGLSLKAILITLIGLLLFGIYVGILIYGENSLTVLNHLNEKKEMLRQEEKSLKAENQKLQKALFELKQLEPKE